MSAETTINLSVKWFKVEPDGQQCVHCGEVCFLNQWSPRFYINGEEMIPYDRIKMIGPSLCQSCYDVFHGENGQ